ncbi:hypothetical protein PENSTE_c005G09631 [Penicillium steckii]|uniref:Zn(2)-C6 fungal-type domain-containing protein n=1 Tax=Penicillium steckii TaxID=303698 RepID=A0A1V6TML5_9EURO|nr:hypothetical protein PENSTE_c005G09631 [Penicillium steckii]
MDMTSYLRNDTSLSSIPSQPPIKRLRKKAPKSRNGCSRCKKRRIKCDEKHPACENCIKLGCQCPGFQQELRWSRPYQRVEGSKAVDDADEIIHPSPLVTSSVQQEESFINDLSPLYPSNTPQNDLDGWRFDDESLPIPIFDSWPFTPQDPLGGLGDENTSLRDDTFPISSPPSGLNATANSGMLRSLTHPPTMLIEHWFRHICPLWSTFDSAVSYSRHLALNAWGSSRAVFYTMQAMSAAYISVTMPHFSQTLNSLKSLAVSAVEEETRLVRRSHSPVVKADLVYAVFTLGNSVNWTASGMDENPWLKSARELMSMWSLGMSTSDVPIHTYFCQALTYWEMLLAARGCGSVPAKLAKKRQCYYVKIHQAMGLPISSNENDNEPCPESAYGPEQAVPRTTGLRPNSWSGVSDEVIDVFGQVLALCHHVHHSSHGGQGRFDTNAATTGLCDVSLAHDLQQELLQMDFDSLLLMDEVHGFPVQTQDDNTPTTYLLQTAEAYRQAALLQLHLSFHDLKTSHAPNLCGFKDVDCSVMGYTAVGDEQSRMNSILSMTLSLVNILERIPAGSGSRSIHLMLYLSAAVGLGVNTSKCSFADHHDNDYWNSGGMGGCTTSPATSEPFNTLTGVDAFLHDLPASNTPSSVDQVVTRWTLEVSKARQFLLVRLGALQQTLPHRRVDSTITFAKDVWRHYDTQDSRPFSLVYWLDIMAKKGSRVTLW